MFGQQTDPNRDVFGRPGGCNHTLNFGCFWLIIGAFAVWLCSQIF